MTRLIHLTILPIFNDEAVYIRWAKMINENFSNIWIPILIDNKKPLLMWLIAVFLKIFEDPLWAARFVSIIAGFLSLIGIYLIGSRYPRASPWHLK
ncbi:MAG: glycosyltransferase family 39 protein [Nitrospinota bacterium]